MNEFFEQKNRQRKQFIWFCLVAKCFNSNKKTEKKCEAHFYLPHSHYDIINYSGSCYLWWTHAKYMWKILIFFTFLSYSSIHVLVIRMGHYRFWKRLDLLLLLFVYQIVAVSVIVRDECGLEHKTSCCTSIDKSQYFIYKEKNDFKDIL